jgi:hypothetical protein
MIATIMMAIEEDLPSQAIMDLCVIAKNGVEFHVGMRALVELGDVLRDHYDPEEKEPDDGTYDEEEAFYWGTEGDDFDPPDDWFEDGGPFDPDDDL